MPIKILKLIKENVIWIILALFIVGIIAFIKEPVFFDNFGIGVFLFLFLSSIWMLNNMKRIPEWLIWLILAISVLGGIIDFINILKG